MKKLSIIGYLVIGFFALGEAVISPCSGGEKFPTKPITFLVGYSPGGAADMSCRYLADFASKALPQPFVVVNRDGGGGALSLGELKITNPDGYTIGFMATGQIMSAHMRKVPYHPIQDFDPIVQYCAAVFGLVVRADSPFQTLKDLIAYAKANPQKVTYSTTGPGSPQHLVMVLLGEEANVKWTHIPFAGGSKALTALLGGHVTCSTQTGIFKPHVNSGRLRLLASIMEKRLVSYPNVPTLIEQGYNVVATSDYKIVGPKGIPKDRIQILDDCFRKGIETPGFKEVMDKLDMEVYYRNPKDTKQRIAEVYEMTRKIIEKYGNEIMK